MFWFCLVRIGKEWLGYVRLGYNRFGLAWFNLFWFTLVRLEKVWLELVMFRFVGFGFCWFILVRTGFVI